MQILKDYSNEVLLQETKRLVEKERQTTLELIECLAEVEARMLFATLGFSSLWQFCTEYLHLSEGAASRRIRAMRLSRHVPEVKDAIADGSLSLSNASKLQSFFQTESKNGRPQSQNQKEETIEKMKGLSQNECDKKLAEQSPQYAEAQKESLKPVDSNHSVLKIVLNEETVEKLKLLKDRMAHKLPHASYKDIVEHLIEDQLKQMDRKMEEKPQADLKNEKSTKEETVGTAAAAVGPILTNKVRRKIPMHTQRALKKRSGGKCEYVSPDGRRCNSAHALEMDHIKPVAMHGSDELSNLREVCRTHNGLFAKEVFGELMENYLPRLRRTE